MPRRAPNITSVNGPVKPNDAIPSLGKEVHRVKNATEATDQIVGRYNVRLVETARSEVNPSGLLVAEYGEQQMVGEREAGLLQKSALDKDRP